MNLAKAPRSIIVVLSLMAALSLAMGLSLEFLQVEELQSHPYLSNLLSGITGFSTSGLTG